MPPFLLSPLVFLFEIPPHHIPRHTPSHSHYSPQKSVLHPLNLFPLFNPHISTPYHITAHTYQTATTFLPDILSKTPFSYLLPLSSPPLFFYFFPHFFCPLFAISVYPKYLNYLTSSIFLPFHTTFFTFLFFYISSLLVLPLNLSHSHIFLIPLSFSSTYPHSLPQPPRHSYTPTSIFFFPLPLPFPNPPPSVFCPDLLRKGVNKQGLKGHPYLTPLSVQNLLLSFSSTLRTLLTVSLSISSHLTTNPFLILLFLIL